MSDNTPSATDAAPFWKSRLYWCIFFIVFLHFIVQPHPKNMDGFYIGGFLAADFLGSYVLLSAGRFVRNTFKK